MQDVAFPKGFIHYFFFFGLATQVFLLVPLYFNYVSIMITNFNWHKIYCLIEVSSNVWSFSSSKLLQDGKTPCVELEFFSGMKLNRGYMSSYFITNRKKQICVRKTICVFVWIYQWIIGCLFLSFGGSLFGTRVMS